MTTPVAPLPRTAPAVRFDHYGGIDVLTVVDVAVSEPGAGEVLVEVRAAGINPGEAPIREGAFDSFAPATFPSGEGTDLAGVVVALGPGVTSVALGDEVLGWSERRSSHATYVVVPADQVIPKPAELSWQVAGSLFVAGVTAFAAVRAVDATASDTVVVSSAAGGVGLIVVQLLRQRGATVVGIASEANHEYLRSLGAVPVSYAGVGAADTLADRIRTLAPNGVDAVIDTHGPEYIDLAIELGVAPERIDTIIAFEAAGAVGAKSEGSSAASTPEALAELASLVASGAVTIPIAATYPLADVRDAFTEHEKRHTRGKIVLLP